MASSIFNVEKQLSFYGAYHTNKWNILIHVICVPLILWSAQVFLTIPLPSFVPHISYPINEYLQFETNWATLLAAVYQLYYFTLEPTGAALYVPQMVLQTLSSTAFAHNQPNAVRLASYLHAFAWVAQFLGHGVAEKRAPALLDNILGAVVLAPFFVHLEILFVFGYNSALYKKIQNLVGIELTRIRVEEGRKKRGVQAKGEDTELKEL